MCGISQSPGSIYMRSIYELNRQLQQSRRCGLQDLAEGRRFQIVLRQPQIGVVEHGAAFGAELHALRLTDIKVLEKREVDISDARSAHHVAALIAYLARLRDRVELLESH